MSTRRKYDPKFKEDVVNLYLETDRSQAQIALDFGIAVSLVGKWARAYKKKHPNLDTRKPNEDELSHLKKQLIEVTMERDILKKAVAIFSAK